MKTNTGMIVATAVALVTLITGVAAPLLSFTIPMTFSQSVIYWYHWQNHSCAYLLMLVSTVIAIVAGTTGATFVFLQIRRYGVPSRRATAGLCLLTAVLTVGTTGAILSTAHQIGLTRSAQDAAICRWRLEIIDCAKVEWALGKHNLGEQVSWEDILPFIPNDGMGCVTGKKPTCPGGGRYIFNTTLGERDRCTIHGAIGDDYNWLKHSNEQLTEQRPEIAAESHGGNDQ